MKVGASISSGRVAQRHDFRETHTPIERREALRREYTEVYSALLHKLQSHYPHLEVLYAVIHFDERNGTPMPMYASSPRRRGISRACPVRYRWAVPSRWMA